MGMGHPVHHRPAAADGDDDDGEGLGRVRVVPGRRGKDLPVLLGERAYSASSNEIGV